MERHGILEVGYSPTKLIALAFGGAAMAVLSGLIALHFISGVESGSKVEFAGYVGMAFFALAAVLTLWRLIMHRGQPVLTLTQTGIRDVRLAAREIPWSEIQALGVWNYKRQKVLVLVVDPVVETGVGLTRVARWSREANRRLGADGLCIGVTGLSIDFQTLSRICHERVARVHGSSEANEVLSRAPIVRI
jgi:hypothetical protein